VCPGKLVGGDAGEGGLVGFIEAGSSSSTGRRNRHSADRYPYPRQIYILRFTVR
jgi:hypothetical protein